MNASAVKLRVIATTNNIDKTVDEMIEDLSKDFELVERSKLYPSRNNPTEARVYLTFQRKENIDNDGGAGSII